MKSKGVQVDPLLLTVDEVATALGMSRSTFYRLLSSGKIGPSPVQLSGKSLFRRRELEEWVAADCPTRDRWQSLRKLQTGV